MEAGESLQGGVRPGEPPPPLAGVIVNSPLFAASL